MPKTLDRDSAHLRQQPHPAQSAVARASEASSGEESEGNSGPEITKKKRVSFSGDLARHRDTTGASSQ